MDNIETICSNSFRNFHTKGFDYLCLSRTPELTRKVYFFDGDLVDLPELVIPHDHRYTFTTTVLAGAIRNVRFSPLRNPHRDLTKYLTLYDHFSYLTPLNGGDGFTWQGEMYVQENAGLRYRKGQWYKSYSEEVHTLDIRCEGTIIMLEQLADDVPLDVPTNAWRKAGSRVPPDLSGLYDRMTPDHARMRINQFLDAVGNR